VGGFGRKLFDGGATGESRDHSMAHQWIGPFLFGHRKQGVGRG
jgi:hypothetical protein